MTVTLTPQREAELLQQYRERQARIRAELAEADQARQHYREVMAKRNSPRIVTANKRHNCSVCGETIIEQQKAWYTPGRIAAKSSRCSDPTFTASRYTCLKCRSIEADKP